jgi:DNA-binding XRE family transcriptional regulator
VANVAFEILSLTKNALNAEINIAVMTVIRFLPQPEISLVRMPAMVTPLKATLIQDTIKISIGVERMSNLKAFRQEMGLSLSELGDLCGKTKACMWELEKPTANPTLRNAYGVAKILNKTVYEIWPDTTEIITETITVHRLKK